MELGAGIENETLQNLIRDCLLELNRLKFDLTELEIAKARDTTPQKIQELENHCKVSFRIILFNLQL